MEARRFLDYYPILFALVVVALIVVSLLVAPFVASVAGGLGVPVEAVWMALWLTPILLLLVFYVTVSGILAKLRRAVGSIVYYLPVSGVLRLGGLADRYDRLEGRLREAKKRQLAICSEYGEEAAEYCRFAGEQVAVYEAELEELREVIRREVFSVLRESLGWRPQSCGGRRDCRTGGTA